MKSSSEEKNEFFRASVGAMIRDRRNRILVLRRKDVTGEAWQLPQGGIRRGEELVGAIQRELREEIGIAPEQFTILDRFPGWLAYELPAEYRSEKVGRGQVQKWFLCELAGETVQIKPDGIEFDAWEWVEEAELLNRAVFFRRPIYRQLLQHFGNHLKS
jgi:putative (di)nucleoside polyphosphate hydrolase